MAKRARECGHRRYGRCGSTSEKGTDVRNLASSPTVPRSLGAVEIGKPLLEAQPNVFAQQLHGFSPLTFRHGVENPPMEVIHLGNQREGVVLAREGKHAQKKTGGIEDFQHPLIAGGLEQKRVKMEIRSDESFQIVAFQSGCPGFFQVGDDSAQFLDEAIERFEHSGAEALPGDFADGVNFEGLAQFVEIDDVLPGGFRDDGATAGLLQHAFGDELAEGFADGCAADAELGSERDFGERSACRESAVADFRQDVLAGQSESAAIAGKRAWRAGGRLQHFNCIQQYANVCNER